MQMELFEDFQPLKTNEWKWTMANDYPTKKNGLKVFSFVCLWWWFYYGIQTCRV